MHIFPHVKPSSPHSLMRRIGEGWCIFPGIMRRMCFRHIWLVFAQQGNEAPSADRLHGMIGPVGSPEDSLSLSSIQTSVGKHIHTHTRTANTFKFWPTGTVLSPVPIISERWKRELSFHRIGNCQFFYKLSRPGLPPMHCHWEEVLFEVLIWKSASVTLHRRCPKAAHHCSVRKDGGRSELTSP